MYQIHILNVIYQHLLEFRVNIIVLCQMLPHVVSPTDLEFAPIHRTVDLVALMEQPHVKLQLRVGRENLRAVLNRAKNALPEDVLLALVSL